MKISVAGTRALHILGDMEQQCISGENLSAKPSLITYTATIAAIGNSLDPAAPKLAQDILTRLYKIHESGAISNLKPRTSTYDSVLNALSRAPWKKCSRASR